MLSWNAPSLLASVEERQWFANWVRVGASPAVAYAMNRAWMETDLRDVLPAVRVPTIVLYREGQYYETYSLDAAKRIRPLDAANLRPRSVGHLPLAGASR
jgi:hypothetical protein